MRRLAAAGFAIAVAAAVNAAICQAAQNLAPRFTLLSHAVVLFWTVVGSVAMLGVYGWLQKRSRAPLLRLVQVSLLALALTILPDIGLLLYPAPWFGPYTPPAIYVLILLHVTCAAAVLATAPLWIAGGRGPT